MVEISEDFNLPKRLRFFLVSLIRLSISSLRSWEIVLSPLYRAESFSATSLVDSYPISAIRAASLKAMKENCSTAHLIHMISGWLFSSPAAFCLFPISKEELIMVMGLMRFVESAS